MSPEEMREAVRLETIFMPYAAARRAAVIAGNRRFVHYTSAVGGLGIISSKRIWMRNVMCMADYSEAMHGFESVRNFFSDEPSKNAFIGALDSCSPGLGIEGLNLFDQWWSDTRFGSYITCLSEHDDEEDGHGRLSMWRAFGNASARVALVLKLPLNEGVSVPLGVLFGPVAYLTDTQVSSELAEVTKNINADAGYLRTLDRQRLLGLVFITLVAAVLSLKHVGFREEREWRVIYSPKRAPSTLIESSIESFEGVPQTVYKLPIDGAASAELASLDVTRLLDRVIIGPNQYAWAMYESFVAALARAGIQDAERRVVISGIPIRS
jgi:hypothetical protein